MTILQKIRDKQSKARIKGLRPKYLMISLSDYEELIDELLKQKVITVFDSDTAIIFGMKIITNENEILRL